MHPQEEVDGCAQYCRRRKPGRSTAIHYRSDANIFSRWAQQLGRSALEIACDTRQLTIRLVEQGVDITLTFAIDGSPMPKPTA